MTTSSDGHFILGSSEGKIYIYSPFREDSVPDYVMWNCHTKSVHTVIFSKDNSHFMSGSLDGQVKIWQWKSIKENEPKKVLGFDEAKVLTSH